MPVTPYPRRYPGSTAPPVNSGPGARIAGRYLLLELLGEGSASRVYLARDEQQGGLVAVKVMPPYGQTHIVTRERFESEIAVGRRVTHQNIARVLDAGTSNQGEPFVVIEALVGETLGDTLRRRHTLPREQALRIAAEAARALSAIHAAGFVHRDVKPDNLFLCADDEPGACVKLIDFGFSTTSARKGSGRHVLGTLEYIAPEQAVADSVDGRTDVYSLGVVLFRMLTGELPFDACAKRGILAHHLMSALPPPSWLNDDLEDAIDTIVLSAVRKHPDNRYTTMTALLEDVEAARRAEAPRGSRLVVQPDQYHPATERGRRAMDSLRARN